MRSPLGCAALAVAALGAGLSAGGDQAAPLAAQAPAVPVAATADVRVLPLRGNVYLVSAGGVNITASVGRDGVVAVDTGAAAMADRVVAALQDLSRRVTSSREPIQPCIGSARACQWWSSAELLPTIASPPAPRPIIGIVNTSDDPDHVGGNSAVAGAGRSFGVRNLGNTANAWVVAHENVTGRLTRAGQDALVATETYFGREKKLNFVNGEGVVVTHHPAAHTDGDSMVYFRQSDVLAAGDVLNMASYPVIDTARGGTIQGVVDALNWILDVAVVEHMMEGGTIVVPGHGRITDAADVAYYRDMMTIFRDRVQHLKEKGMTLEQVKAAGPTRDYDGRYGKNPAWTPAMLVEAIYGTVDSK